MKVPIRRQPDGWYTVKAPREGAFAFHPELGLTPYFELYCKDFCTASKRKAVQLVRQLERVDWRQFDVAVSSGKRWESRSVKRAVAACVRKGRRS